MKGNKKAMDNLVASLRTIVDASWISTEEKAKVQQLLQTEDSDEDLTLQPQATTSSYETHDGGILETLTGLKNKAEESLSKARKTEMEAQHAYEMLKQSIEMELSGMQKRMSAATSERSSTEETMHAATAELEETKKSLEKKGSEVTKLSGRLEARQASIAEMTMRKAEITEELSNLKTALSEATLLRQEEKANSVKMTSEYGDAVKIIESAMNVLNEVFAEKATAGNTIIGILEVAQSDFSKLLAEAQAQEAAAEADYKKMSSEAKVREAALGTEMEGVTRMTLETQSDEQHLTRELDSVQKEVEAVQSYLEQLKPQCTVKTPSHEERAARREKEIDGLQNALGALSGEAIA